MSDHLPPELRDRVRAYIEDVAPAGEVAELESRILEQLEGRRTQQSAQVMAITHELVSQRVRITPEAAAGALVEHGGLSPIVAAHIVGLPVDAVPGAQDATEDEPASGEPVGEPVEEPVEEPAGEPVEDEDPIIDGWDAFWTPPAVPPAGTEDDAAGAPPPDEPAPDGATPEGAPPAPRVPIAFDTWSGREPGGGRDGRGGLVAAAVVAGVVLLAVVGAATLGGDGGEPTAVGEPTNPPGTDAPATDAPATEGPTVRTPADGVTVGSAQVAADDGGALRAGRSALLSMTVSGTEDQPATLRWELRRDGDEVFPPAPLVVPADGDVRLTIPPALLTEAGDYLVRVSQDGTVLLERDFVVAAG